MKMRVHMIWLVCLSVIAGKITAQSLEAGYGHFGAMVYWQGPLPAEDAEIRRFPSGSGTHDREWKIRPARQVRDFMENQEGLPTVFRDVLPFTEKSAAFYLDKLGISPTTETLPIGQAPNVLFALGLAVWDTTVVQGQDYTYQIFYGNTPKGEKVSLRTVLTESYDWMPVYHSATHDERIIRGRWRIPYDKKPDVYTYLTYRTAPFKPEYALVKGISSFAVSGDTILAVFMDTSVRATPGVYQYMIRTVNRFGHLGPVSEYALGSNFPPETEPVMVYFKAKGMDDKPAIRLNWRLLNPWRIRSMSLFRSRKFDGPYEMIGHFSATDTTYVDPVTDVMESYFYYFEMEDIAHDVTLTTARVTSVSPYHWPAEIPDSVSAEVHQKQITLQWKRAGFQDRGYYVLRAKGFGAPEEIVSPMIPVRDGQAWYAWTDTSSVLSPDYTYTYAVISESIGYEKSAPSETVQARPEVPIYVPAPTDLKLTWLTDTTFLLRWSDLSTNVALHHLGYKVFKKDVTAKDGYKPMQDELLLFETNYLEMTGVRPEDVFVVKAYNIHGDESVYSEPVSLVDPQYYRFGPEYLMGKNDENGILVQWNRPLKSGIQGYRLYRIGADQKMDRIAQPTVGDIQYLDTGVKKGETYYYFITAVTGEDMESEASEMLNITR